MRLLVALAASACVLVASGCAADPVPGVPDGLDPFGRPYRADRILRDMPLEHCEGASPLDKHPVLVFGSRPLFPAGELFARHTETVEIHFTVSETGKAEVVDPSKEPRDWFASHARVAMRDWQVTPAMAKGVPVAATCSLRFQYLIHARD